VSFPRAAHDRSPTRFFPSCALARQFWTFPFGGDLFGFLLLMSISFPPTTNGRYLLLLLFEERYFLLFVCWIWTAVTCSEIPFFLSLPGRFLFSFRKIGFLIRKVGFSWFSDRSWRGRCLFPRYRRKCGSSLFFSVFFFFWDPLSCSLPPSFFCFRGSCWGQ